MSNKIFELLQSDLLNEDTRVEIKQALQEKLEEERIDMRQSLEESIRREFSTKFEHDKERIVEAINSMVTDAITKQATESLQEVNNLKEARIKLTNTIQESRKQYNDKIKSHTALIETFITDELYKELSELKEDQKQLHVEKQEEIKQLKEEYNKKIQKFEGFILEQLQKEISELHEDIKDLANTKVKIVKESKEKLAELKESFIKRAAPLVEKTISSTLEKELSQLKEDIQVAKENKLGARVFETFFHEFLGSNLSESTQSKKMYKELVQTKRQLAESTEQLNKNKALYESVKQKVGVAEETATRGKVLFSLLSPLPKDRQEIMGRLLEGVQTSRLQESFNKYLPGVIGEVKSTKTQLNENTSSKLSAQTGNKRKVLEESQEYSDQNDEIFNITRLAGIKQ
jgi:hypothetical protein